MQNGSSVHHAKLQLRNVTSEDYTVREISIAEPMPCRLLDPPAYADVRKNSYSFEDRPDTQNKVGMVDYNRHTKYKVHKGGEDVNTEADDFIKHEHKKFKLRQKAMSFFR